MRIRGRRRKQLLHDRKEHRGYWQLIEVALDRTMWRTGFGRGLWTGRRTDCGMSEWMEAGWKEGGREGRNE